MLCSHQFAQSQPQSALLLVCQFQTAMLRDVGITGRLSQVRRISSLRFIGAVIVVAKMTNLEPCRHSILSFQDLALFI